MTYDDCLSFFFGREGGLLLRAKVSVLVLHDRVTNNTRRLGRERLSISKHMGCMSRASHLDRHGPGVVADWPRLTAEDSLPIDDSMFDQTFSRGIVPLCCMDVDLFLFIQRYPILLIFFFLFVPPWSGSVAEKKMKAITHSKSPCPTMQVYGIVKESYRRYRSS